MSDEPSLRESPTLSLTQALVGLWWELRVTAHFFHAVRRSDHKRFADRIADAAAMLLTRALRLQFPEAQFPYVIELTKAHARDAVSNRKDGSSQKDGDS